MIPRSQPRNSKIYTKTMTSPTIIKIRKNLPLNMDSRKKLNFLNLKNKNFNTCLYNYSYFKLSYGHRFQSARRWLSYPDIFTVFLKLFRGLARYKLGLARNEVNLVCIYIKWIKIIQDFLGELIYVMWGFLFGIGPSLSNELWAFYTDFLLMVIDLFNAIAANIGRKLRVTAKSKWQL